ncbi:MAG: hypothetical protein FWE50_04115 [Alphaproteobacteria bacterium]|nr:hypothetical protein [Alphaproteobacteria bacterium]
MFHFEITREEIRQIMNDEQRNKKAIDFIKKYFEECYNENKRLQKNQINSSNSGVFILR